MGRTHKIKRGRSLKNDIFLFMVFIAILPMAIYLYLDIFITREKYKAEIDEFLFLSSDHVAEELNRMFVDRYNDLMILANNPIIKSAKYTNEEKIAEMQKVQDLYHYFDDISYVDSSGTITLSTTYNYFYDIDKTIWFKDAMKGKPVITSPYLISMGNRMVMSFFQPVFSKDNVVGVLTARMDMKKVWDITNADTLKWNDYGYIIVLDNFLKIVSHPNKETLYKKLKGIDLEKVLDKKNERKVIGFLDDSGMEFVAGVNVLDTIPGVVSSPYFVLAVQAKDEAYALSNYMIIRDLLQLTAMASLIILISLYFSNRLTRPIEEIIEGTKSISEWKLGKTVDIKSWEEINDIARAFNSMSLALKDNTERLVQSERRYRTLVEDIDDGYFILEDKKIIYYNEAAARITGYDNEEALGKNITDFYPEEMRPLIEEKYQEVFKESGPGDAKKFEMPFYRKNGEQIFVEFRPKLISSVKDRIVAGIMVDISARKRREMIEKEYQKTLKREVMLKTKELSESETKYRTLFENMDQAIFVVQDGLVTFFNPSALELTEYSEEELKDKPFLDLVHPEDRDLMVDRYIKLYRGESLTYPYIFRMADKGGKMIWVEGMGVTIKWEDTRADLAFINNVTERILAERALRESEEKYRNLFETSKDVIYISTIEGRLIDMNPIAEEFFGYTRDELLALDTRDLYINSEERERFQRDIEKNGFVRNYELTLKRSDGAILDCIETSTVLRDDDGNITGYHGTIKDITERKKMETLILNSRNRLMTAFDAVSDRMFIVDEDYRMKFINRKICEELASGFDMLLNTKCYLQFNTKDEPCPECPLQRSIEYKEGTSGEVFIGGNGEGSCFFVSVYPIESEEGDYDYLIYSRDITEEKRFSERLIQQDRLVSLGQLSAGVAHEINNPLTAILGYAQLLLKDVDKERREYKDLKIIEEQALNCKTILEEMLIFSRSRVDKREYFLFKDILHNVIVLNKKELKEKNINLIKKIKNDLPTFYGDQIKMTQVFLNVLQNSIYAVENGGEIIIETSWDKENNMVLVTFMDNGPGVPEENKRRIFDPFFTTKPAGQGTGLGLSVSYGIVNEHGGGIAIENAPGGGAKFIIALPVEEELPD
ncbi:MAG: PAS domain S-box protein [Deltaproteobacteria bacterium]|uniref:histidine kinase n=1 Tax=Candidatus Zymogenus saltonus TaxID=2844893 RepID=A0A9D8PNF8_9DELT|nr:PAS domain S-box protein [Candidatus Zymogenus saltonus]